MGAADRTIASCAVTFAFAAAAFAQAPYIAPTADMFSDDFGSGIVDPAKWYAANKNWGGKDATTDEDYNGGVVPANLGVRDGILRCTAHGNLYEGDVAGIAKNGRPRADGKRVGACAVTREYFASGSYEIRARVAPVAGVCCAMWTFEYEELYPGDPGFQGNGECYVVNHEIDIEMPGRPGSAHTGIGYDYALCNTWVGENDNECTSSHMRLPAPQDDGAFHVYRFDWHTGDAAGTIVPRVEFYFDGVPVVTNYTHIPTKAGRFWVGAWFPNGWAGTPDFDTSVFEVDYVKITPFHEENDKPQNETYGADGLAEPINPLSPTIWVVGTPAAEAQTLSICFRKARETASERFATPRRSKIAERCFFTVISERPNCRAISAFDWPSATEARISIWRSVSLPIALSSSIWASSRVGITWFPATTKRLVFSRSISTLSLSRTPTAPFVTAVASSAEVP